MVSAASKVVYWGIVLGLLWAGLRWFERANLYIPSREHLFHPGTYGIAYEDVDFQAADGTPLHAWFVDGRAGRTAKNVPNDPPLPELLPLKRPAAPIVLFFHGNGGNISHRVQKLRVFRQMGVSVLIFDYRGYGKSKGSPSEKGTYLDGAAAVKLLQDRTGVAPEDLVYYAESLGCGVAVETALRFPPAALILDSGFTSTAAMGREVFPFLPVKWMVRYRYDNLSKMPSLRSPLLVMHSPGDDIVPYSMGKSLFEAAPEPKGFFESQGNHNEGFLDTKGWGRSIRDFLDRSLRG